MDGPALTLDLTWTLVLGEERVTIEPVLFALLEGVREGGHLNHAARAAGVSYRHAWGLMRAWETRLETPLILLERGRGASLTPVGTALLAARTTVRADLAPVLERAASAAARSLAGTLRPAPRAVRVASSHGESMAALAEELGAARWNVTLETTGSERALRRYQRGDADVAGFHLPLGELGRTVSQVLLALLDDDRDHVFLLERRVLGLMSRPDLPVQSLDALPDSGLRLINRQPGSGTRLVLDGLLGAKGIAPGAIEGYRREEHTHTAVAAIVASGAADAGLGIAGAAAQFGLSFTPLVQERFYVCLRRGAHRSLVRQVAAFAERTLAQGPPAAPGERAPIGEMQPSVASLRRLHNAL